MADHKPSGTSRSCSTSARCSCGRRLLAQQINVCRTGKCAMEKRSKQDNKTNNCVPLRAVTMADHHFEPAQLLCTTPASSFLCQHKCPTNQLASNQCSYRMSPAYNGLPVTKVLLPRILSLGREVSYRNPWEEKQRQT